MEETLSHPHYAFSINPDFKSKTKLANLYSFLLPVPSLPRPHAQTYALEGGREGGSEECSSAPSVCGVCEFQNF
jgi:hypothetical protein